MTRFRDKSTAWWLLVLTAVFVVSFLAMTIIQRAAASGAVPVAFLVLYYGFYLVWIATIIGFVVVTIRHFVKRSAKPMARGPIPMAHTVDGEPVYAVVGYTADGVPVTADRIGEGGPAIYNGRTNSLAVVALVLGVVAAPFAIPFGHIARSQIRRTGEQGAGMALAGLILGYISVIAIVIVIIWISATLYG